jgi:antitoxin component of RelBE/YafQ-DinJ toxin-antitoxin module
MNITLSIDENILKKARKVAQAMDKSINQLVREYLEQLAMEQGIENDIAELRQLSAESKGYSAGWCFNRDEIHERA